MSELLASSRGLWLRNARVPSGSGRICRGFVAGLLLTVGACRADLPQDPPESFVTAIFDPQTSQIPLPNDLVFLSDNLNGVCPPGKQAPSATPACAQAELLAAFNGFFPNDQEVPITIEFTQTNFDAAGATTLTAPDLDLASFTPSTYFVVSFGQSGATEVAMEPIQASDYVKSAEHGTLTLHRKDNLPWAPGNYAVLVRGGADGIKTTGGLPVHASQVFHLIAQGLDMTDPRNLGLLRAQFGSLEDALELGQQLNLLINLIFKPAAFPAADTRFPHQQLAIAATFKVSGFTNVPIDPSRSLVPLPIDLLRDPTTNRLTPLAACTLAGAPLGSDGRCTAPAAAGFLALDGFSTTGAILAQTSELIQASTVTADALRLYDLTNPLQPVRVDPSTLLIQPCELSITNCVGGPGLAPALAIQPAGASAGDPTSVFRTKPLKDNTDYAVVITNDIRDRNNNPIAKSTAGAILAFSNPVVVDGRSALLGVDDATAGGLERIRQQLQPVYAKAAEEGVPKNKVVMAYTFRTQTILSQATQLAALPYVTPAATAAPIAATLVARAPDAAFTRFGVDKTRVPGELAGDNIDEIIEVDILTFNALDPATGAFLANPANAALEPIHVLIATPKTSNPNIPACQGPLAPFGKCAPLMVFRHGLGRGRLDMLAVADANAAAGMVTVAIDAAKHGDRSFCTSGTTGAASGCNGGGACTTGLPAGAQGDVNPPGSCGAAGFVKRPVSPTCTGQCATDATEGIPAVSGNYLISANFFRTRDSMRQDLIDQSQLVRALAFVPSGIPPTSNAVFDHIFTRAAQQTGTPMIINPQAIFYSGQSLGAIQGAMNVAANPRISKAVLNVGGGTIVDLFTNSPAFTAQVNELLAGLGIQRGTARFLQFLVVTKTILDPADPVNYAGHLTANTLPNLLATPPVLQTPKKILTQIANCDAVVPNPFSLIKASNVPASPLPSGAAFFAPGARGTFQLFVGAGFNPQTTPFGTCTSGAAVASHGFLTDWTVPTLAAKAQADLATFVMTDALPLTVQAP
jgi:hypothetical protein